MSDIWVVFVFSPPPKRWGFVRARSGKCWLRKLEGKAWALELGKQLAARGIHGKISRDKPRAERPQGKRSRMAIPESVSAELAAMIKEQFEVYKAGIASQQHVMATTLPEPIRPPQQQRQARSVAEQREMDLRRLGRL